MKKDKIELLFDKICKILHLKFEVKTRKLLIQIFKFSKYYPKESKVYL